VHADEAVPGADVALEGSLLGIVEHVARGVEKDDGVKTGEGRVVEGSWVHGRLYGEIVDGAQSLDGGDSRGDRRVAVAGRAGEYEDPERGVRNR
jgi:hypothetical protein